MEPIFTLVIEDDERIGSILAELVSSTPGFSLLGLNDFGRRLVIEVEDSGEGVDEALADHLFDYGISRQTGDHGVGLFLVKETVARRGGVIEWRRTAEQTTLFGIYLNKNQLV